MLNELRDATGDASRLVHHDKHQLCPAHPLHEGRAFEARRHLLRHPLMLQHLLHPAAQGRVLEATRHLLRCPL